MHENLLLFLHSSEVAPRSSSFLVIKLHRRPRKSNAYSYHPYHALRGRVLTWSNYLSFKPNSRTFLYGLMHSLWHSGGRSPMSSAGKSTGAGDSNQGPSPPPQKDRDPSIPPRKHALERPVVDAAPIPRTASSPHRVSAAGSCTSTPPSGSPRPPRRTPQESTFLTKPTASSLQKRRSIVLTHTLSPGGTSAFKTSSTLPPSPPTLGGHGPRVPIPGPSPHEVTPSVSITSTVLPSPTPHALKGSTKTASPTAMPAVTNTPVRGHQLPPLPSSSPGALPSLASPSRSILSAPISARRAYHRKIDQHLPAGTDSPSTSSSLGTSPNTSVAPGRRKPGPPRPHATPSSSSLSSSSSTATTKLVVMSAAEKAMDGAPQGRVYQVQVRNTEDLPPSLHPALDLDLVLETVKEGDAALHGGQRGEEERGHADWAREYECIDAIRRLALHPSLGPALLRPHLPLLLPFLLRSVHNLRSSMQRNALLCLRELFVPAGLGPAFPPFLEPMCALLLRQLGHGDKKFIRVACEGVLAAAVGAEGGATVPFLLPALLPMVKAKKAEEAAGSLLWIEQGLKEVLKEGGADGGREGGRAEGGEESTLTRALGALSLTSPTPPRPSTPPSSPLPPALPSLLPPPRGERTDAARPPPRVGPRLRQLSFGDRQESGEEGADSPEQVLGQGGGRAGGREKGGKFRV
ncbi:Armadillo-like helical [Nannochloropsis gaditana]|uniref:Armadillo-like helical n=1 Tax=Nannochloropsis gaditana TaxID=72520 RepID=W7T7Y5_9STRA|nr:Armadillo-like helical [Nannochloropsis gaditana]